MTKPDPFLDQETLPEALPEEPMLYLEAWLDHATRERIQPNPNAMTLATTDPDGRPSARVVLCKGLEVDPGCVIFYTNKQSRKGSALAHSGYASLVFHWDTLDRQVRVEGPVTDVSEAESDAYFHSRHPASRVGAWASDQSQPIGSRDDLLEKVVGQVGELGLDFDAIQDGSEATIPRPPHWGGYRVWAERVELWLGSSVRIHDRAEWTRALVPASGGGYEPGAWSSTRLQP